MWPLHTTVAVFGIACASFAFYFSIRVDHCNTLRTMPLTLNAFFRDRRASYNFAFSVLCGVWGILRTMLFFPLGFWFQQPVAVLYTIYWLPINLQFTIFSLLVLFYISVLNKTTWENRTRRRATIIFVVINVLLMAGFIACVVAQAKEAEWADSARSIFTIIVFAILSVFLGYYGWNVRLHMLDVKTQLPQLLGVTPTKVGLATLISVILFLSRCVYQALSLVLNFSFTFTNVYWQRDAITSTCYVLWEVVPTAMVIILFWRKSSARKVPDPLRVFPYYSAIGLNADQDDSSPTATIGAYATPSRFSEVRANERESTQLFPGSKGSPMIGSYYTGTSYSPPV